MGILRFILALSVVVGHSDHALGLNLIHTTVAVRSFYVVSGFYMALVLNTKYIGKPYYVFIRSRYLRLAPAYWCTLALTLLLGTVVYFVRGTVEWPFQAWSRTITDLPTGSLVALAFSNAFILGQDILSYCIFDSSGSLKFNLLGHAQDANFSGYMLISQAWTLGIEFLFYLTAPLLVTRGMGVILATSAASLGCKYILYPAFGFPAEALGYRFFPFELIYFMLGAISYHILGLLRSRPPGKTATLAATIILGLAYVIPQSEQTTWTRYALLALCIPFLFTFTGKSRADRIIGELSYPMYITHLLVFYTLTQFTGWSTEGAGTAITIALSFLMFLLVDRRIDRWREEMARVSIRSWPHARTVGAAALAISFVIAVPLVIRHVAQTTHLARSLPIESHDLLKVSPAQLVTVGLEPAEYSGDTRWRWGMGPKTEMLFSLPVPVNITLTLEYDPLAEGQEVAVEFNGTPIETLSHSTGQRTYRQYLLPGRKENNVIKLSFNDWNHKTRAYVPGDSRQLAVSFNKLELTFPPSAQQ